MQHSHTHSMTYFRRRKHVFAAHMALSLLCPLAVHSLFIKRDTQFTRSAHTVAQKQGRLPPSHDVPNVQSSRLSALPSAEADHSTQQQLGPDTALTSALETEEPLPSSEFKRRHILLQSYAIHWTTLLQREYHETLRDLQLRRKSYTRQQLEDSGFAILSAVATTETEIYGEKVVRVTLPERLHKPLLKHGRETADGEGERKLQDRFKRGDALSLSPLVAFRGKEVPPREALVMEVGTDYLTLGVGSTWPSGLLEMRKYDTYLVRLDRSLSNAPLKAQQASLDQLRKGRAGDAAELLVRLFYGEPLSLDTAEEEISDRYFDLGGQSLEEQVEGALVQAMQGAKFVPNLSQQEAIVWALRRKISLIRGPPGTGKTRVAALLISTALNMKLRQTTEGSKGNNDGSETRAPRILAVAHSNGAADVLLQALLQMNVPAVRAGRPASVSPAIQHRTIAALAERLPEVLKLRQQAGDATLDRDVRQGALYTAKQYTNDGQKMIAATASVVVASCIGAQQILASLVDKDKENEEPPFHYVVLDEAGQSTEAALICALDAAKARQLILVGDTMQLPPTVTTRDVELRKTIGVSPMERLISNGVKEFVLKEQYRMHPALLEHPNKAFYKNVVQCALNDGATNSLPPPKGFPWPSIEKPLAFIDVGDDSEIAHNFGGRSNPRECKTIVSIVQKVVSEGGVEADQIAIITPYNKQVQLLRTELGNASQIHCNKMLEVKVGSVDSFQGQEKDLVVLSAVRSNRLNELGFLRDYRRLNVAITRAKRGLIVVGDATTLKSCKHWKSLLESCRERGCAMTEEQYILAKAQSPRNTRKIDPDELELDLNDEFFGLF